MSVAYELEQKDFLELRIYTMRCDGCSWVQRLEGRPERYQTTGALSIRARDVNEPCASRALYEFFYSRHSKSDETWACQFGSDWDESKECLCLKYMASEKPADKRGSHLVHNWSKHSERAGDDGLDHLKEHVLAIVKDLRTLTERLIECVEPDIRRSAQSALRESLNEAQREAEHYGGGNPLADSCRVNDGQKRMIVKCPLSAQNTLF